MTEEQKTAHRIKMKARVKLLQLDLRVGKATQAQVDEAQKAYDALLNFTPTKEPEIKLTTGKAAPEPEKLNGKALTAEAQTILSELGKKQDDIDRQKRELSMSLQSVAHDVPCREITQQILFLREQWKEVGDTIYFVKEHGHLPNEAADQSEEQDPAEYAEKLPKDRFVLDKLIKNLNINVNHKWPKRMAEAKTEAKKSEYRLRIAKGEQELEIMKEQFSKLQA